MSYLSPLLTMMVNAVKKSTASLDRDFSEIERLQSSVRPYQNFINNSYTKVAQTLHAELGRVKPDAVICDEDVQSIPATGSCFLLNPIDGLSNFARGIAMFATTVVYCENGEIKASVVYNRASDELYFAEKGNGAYKDGFRSHERLRVSSNKEASLAVIAAQVGYKTGTNEAQKAYEKVFNWGAQSRFFGSVSLSMAYVAAGKSDVAVSLGGGFNSTVAGLLLVREAGGYVFNLQAKEIAPAKIEQVLVSDNVAAANTNMEAVVKKFA